MKWKAADEGGYKYTIDMTEKKCSSGMCVEIAFAAKPVYFNGWTRNGLHGTAARNKLVLRVLQHDFCAI